MQLTAENLAIAFKGFKAVFSDAYNQAPAFHETIAMRVNSSSYSETYGWLGEFPAMREWVGARQIQEQHQKDFEVKNALFESTVKIKRTDFEDDRYGVYKPQFSNMGRLSKQHPDQLLFGLLASGTTRVCYDNQNFFDAEHPIGKSEEPDSLVSNFQAGTEPAWYLLDTRHEVKPLIWQVRADYDLQMITSDKDDHVFMYDEYKYGIRARANAGFGLWQMAYCSQAELTPENYALARASMASITGDNGLPLGVEPSLLIVPYTLEAQARQLLKADKINDSSNIWKDSAELIVTPYLVQQSIDALPSVS